MSTKESSARTMQAIRATVHQELNEVDFHHTNAQMVDARVRGDEAGRDVSFSIGLAVFFLEGTGTKTQKLAAVREIGQAVITAADLLQADLLQADLLQADLLQAEQPAEQLELGTDA